MCRRWSVCVPAEHAGFVDDVCKALRTQCTVYARRLMHHIIQGLGHHQQTTEDLVSCAGSCTSTRRSWSWALHPLACECPCRRGQRAGASPVAAGQSQTCVAGTTALLGYHRWRLTWQACAGCSWRPSRPGCCAQCRTRPLRFGAARWLQRLPMSCWGSRCWRWRGEQQGEAPQPALTWPSRHWTWPHRHYLAACWHGVSWPGAGAEVRRGSEPRSLLATTRPLSGLQQRQEQPAVQCV